MRNLHDNERSSKDAPGQDPSAAGLSSASRSIRPGKRSGIAGQTVVLAVIVMFLLMFLGGVFVALLRRNLDVTLHHGDALSAQQLAEAGIQYANNELTNSVDGADWRPVPYSPPAAAAGPGCPAGPPAQPLDSHDPDFNWIRPYAPADDLTKPYTIPDTRADRILNPKTGVRDYPTLTLYQRGPTGGFTRIESGGGRFLIRVTYNPSNNPATGPIAPDATGANAPSPLSRFIRIESVGREGIVDQNDPTTYVPQSLKRELVAFKPIALVDYIRFITDRERSGSLFSLGATKFPLIGTSKSVTDNPGAVKAGVPGIGFSSQDLSGVNAPGHIHNLDSFYGPVRSNGGLQIVGEPMIALDEDPQVNGAKAASRGDRIEVVGQVDRTTSNDNLWILAPNLSPAVTLWSGAAGPNVGGTQSRLVQGVNRIEPPDIGAVDPETHVPRYRLLTRFSTPLISGLTPTQSEVAARNGLGSGIYLDNGSQRQKDIGRFTVVDDWMQPANNVTSNWTGHIYNPPGVRIQLIPHPVQLMKGSLVDGKQVTEDAGILFKNGLIRITRSDRSWRVPDPANPTSRDGVDTGRLTEYFQYPLFPGQTAPLSAYPPAFANGVIYAEGNVRIWGKLPPDESSVPCGRSGAGHQLTIVSNGTIYVEGSLMKGDPSVAGAKPQSGIALLAQDYITVNPTAYFTIPPETNSGDWSTYAGSWYNTLYLPPQDRYSMYLLNGADPNSYPADSTSDYLVPPGLSGSDAKGTRQELYTQASGESTPGSGVTLQVNGNTNGSPNYHPWWSSGTNQPYGHYLPGKQWTYEVTPLWPLLGSFWSTGADIPNWLQFNWKALTPAWISKVAVAPLDVRIEAAMYAMNGSFFIIPGEPFNNDPLDSRSSYLDDNNRRHGALSRLPRKSSFPFAKEPLDIKLTILGAIAENKPAPAEAQEAWSRLWGWTPLNKASGAQTAHGGDGLSFQFDPDLRSTLRSDLYGRPLPLMPRLPVGPDLVFSGEAQ